MFYPVSKEDYNRDHFESKGTYPCGKRVHRLNVYVKTTSMYYILLIKFIKFFVKQKKLTEKEKHFYSIQVKQSRKHS